MRNFIKNNKITLLSILVLIIWGLYYVIFCYKEGSASGDPMIQYYHMISDLNLNFIQILAPLFVFIPAIWHFHKHLSTGFIKNCLTRMSYKQYIRKHYLKALKKAFILPCFVIILLLCCCILTNNFHFGSKAEWYGWLTSPNPKYLNMLGTFILVYIINMFLHSIFYINLGLLYCKKYSNILVNIVLSYITFIAMDILMEIFIGNLLLAVVLNIHNVTDSLNLFNIWIYDNVISLPFSIAYALILVIVSTIIVHFIYRNKEGVIIEVEK